MLPSQCRLTTAVGAVAVAHEHRARTTVARVGVAARVKVIFGAP